jgi:RNA polymerase sigma-70 factor (ECF subfamily)
MTPVRSSEARQRSLAAVAWVATIAGKGAEKNEETLPATGATGVTPTDEGFPEFLARLRAGDGAAAGELFQRFAQQLLALARRQVGGGLQHKVDPEDVVQSAYKSFFRRYGAGNLHAVNWNSLWGLLTLITLRKCAERVAYHRAQCRDAAREAARPANAEGSAFWEEAISREPTPVEAALLSEVVDQLLASLDEDERPVLELSLQGYTTQEISQRLDRPERTVRRLRERVRERLERGQMGED